MIAEPCRRRDVLNPCLVFRSIITGRHVSRLSALVHPYTTFAEKRWPS